MSSENVIHIKLNYMEALKAKRSILSSEMISLKIARIIDIYRRIRLEELMVKYRLYGKMKEAGLNIKRLQSLLPTPKIPKIIKRDEFRKKYPAAESRTYGEEGIESQLREIQGRLEELQSEDI